MASTSLVNRVKYSPLLYNVYFKLGCFLIKLLKFFIKADDKLILFASYSGKQYDDSPKEIYEAMLNDRRFDGYKLIWAFRNPEKFVIERDGKVKVDTLSYYKTALKARVWVTNVSMTRGLNFRGKHCLSLNTWHGTPIKMLGSDLLKNSGGTFVCKGSGLGDVVLAQGMYEKDILMRVFGLDTNQVVVTGLPRNDSLASVCNSKITDIRQKLGIPVGRKIIFYAPTYREYVKDEGRNCVMRPPFNLEMWKERLGDDFVLLIRAHQEVVKVLDLVSNDFVRNVSNYPDLNELMIVSDILISDYSSIFFDFSIMHKPMLCYCYDYEEYAEKRGVYIDIRKWLPSAQNEEELLSLIKNTNLNVKSETAQKFQERFVTEYGSATKKALDIIIDSVSV